MKSLDYVHLSWSCSQARDHQRDENLDEFQEMNDGGVQQKQDSSKYFHKHWISPANIEQLQTSVSVNLEGQVARTTSGTDSTIHDTDDC